MKSMTSWTAMVALATAACGTPITSPEVNAPLMPSPSQANEGDLRFLRNAADAPALATLSTSFWAVKGQTRETAIYYRARLGAIDSTRLVRFRVDKKSLLTRPDGTPFATGDSILITVTVVDSTRLIVDFQPSGLRFDPKNPARLWFKWTETDPDLNDDGLVNSLDDSVRLATSIWAQEIAGGPWSSLATEFNLATQQVEAKPTGFTRYAVAY